MKILITYPGLETLIQGKKIIKGVIESNKSSKLTKIELEEIVIIKFTDLNNLIKQIKIPIKESFTITCNRVGKHEFSSLDLKQALTKKLKEEGLTPNHKNPETKIHVEIINNLAIIGKNKKENKALYKVRSTQGSISRPIANALLIQSEITPKEILYDPFCKDGTLAIEAKLNGIKEVYINDKSTNLYSAKVNATIAKIALKENPKNINQIITVLPSPSKRTSENLAKRIISTIPKATKYTFLIQKPEALKEFLKGKTILKKTKVLIGDQHQFIITIK